MMWWGWMVLGALLLSAELFAVDAQFYLVFLGVSAALVGVLALAGIELPEWGQWALFAVLALISFVTFRKSLYEKLRGGARKSRSRPIFPWVARAGSNSTAASGPPGMWVTSRSRPAARRMSLRWTA
jgi:hypothetical protein